jgi:guanine deaminase
VHYTPEQIELFMRQAIGLARTGMQDGRGGPFGAVVVKNGEVIGRGSNQVVRVGDPTAHAEVVAIRGACAALGTHSLAGSVIFSSCEPCPMCLSAIYWARIDRLWYAASRDDAARVGFDDALLFAELARPAEQRRLPTGRLLEQEARRVLEEWLTHPGKVSY